MPDFACSNAVTATPDFQCQVRWPATCRQSSVKLAACDPTTDDVKWKAHAFLSLIRLSCQLRPISETPFVLPAHLISPEAPSPGTSGARSPLIRTLVTRRSQSRYLYHMGGTDKRAGGESPCRLAFTVHRSPVASNSSTTSGDIM